MGALEEFLSTAIRDCVEARWQKLEWCPSNAEPPCLNTPAENGGACEVCVAQGFEVAS